MLQHEKEKLKIIRDIFGSHHKVGAEYLVFCPFCPSKHHKRKLSINLEKGMARCWVCGFASSTILALILRATSSHNEYVSQWKSLDGDSGVDFSLLFNKSQNNAPTRCNLPSGFKFLGDLQENHQAWQYLKQRGLDIKDVIRYRLGVCLCYQYRERIIFPSFDVNGDCNYFTGRLYVEKENVVPYLNCDIDKNEIIFNDLFIDWTKPITLVEGPFDLVKAGENSVPVLGSTLPERSMLFQKIVYSGIEVNLCLDPDADKKSMRISDDLSLYGISVKKIPVRPFKDPGNMTKEQFQEHKTRAVALRRNDLKARIDAI